MAVLSLLMIALLVISGGATWEEAKESESFYPSTSGI
jgi:hypothetical protein